MPLTQKAMLLLTEGEGKKSGDPGGLEHVGAEHFPPDLAFLRQKRSELVLRQVKEMEEADENMMPCLKPYKMAYSTKQECGPKTS